MLPETLGRTSACIGGCTTHADNFKGIERPDQIINVRIVRPTLQLLLDRAHRCPHGHVSGLGTTLVEG